MAQKTQTVESADRTPKCFAVTHAPIGTSLIVEADTFVPGMSMPTIRRISGTLEKLAAYSDFGPGDTVYIEMGGANDQVALQATAMGAHVMSIASFSLGDANSVTEFLKEHTSWPLPEEKPRGGETGDKLTARRNRTLGLVACAMLNDARLVPFGVAEWQFLKIKLLYRSYRQAQQAYLKAFQQLLARLRLEYMMQAAEKTVTSASTEPTTTAKPARRTKKATTAQESLNLLLTMFSDEERTKFLAKVGISDESFRSAIPKERIDELFELLTEKLMATDSTVSTLASSMLSTRKTLETTLADMPVYTKVFEPIPGCGPLIAARVMANIVDIRRFKNEATLKAFAGYHLFEDGTRARRRAGSVSNWSTEFKQAIYLLCDQTLKRTGSPWRLKLDARRAYELYKLLKARQAEADAMGLNVEILPTAYADRTITSVMDMTPLDYEVKVDSGKRTKPTAKYPEGKPIMKLVGGLSYHVDQLRDLAGVARVITDEDEMEAGTDEAEAEAEAAAPVKNPELAKLMKGLKKSALDKGLRWLGQKLIEHIFKEWRKAIGLPEHVARPIRTNPVPGNTADTTHSGPPQNWRPVTPLDVPYLVPGDAE